MCHEKWKKRKEIFKKESTFFFIISFTLICERLFFRAVANRHFSVEINYFKVANHNLGILNLKNMRPFWLKKNQFLKRKILLGISILPTCFQFKETWYNYYLFGLNITIYSESDLNQTTAQIQQQRVLCNDLYEKSNMAF